ncbi:hypothetical protein TSOC_009350 [Tetrabaena socialis]|uniref:Ankyrin repeat domain-containing protein n=1 Tax=Tetrabaena socialis TaxID=47790 RepID=A0A2J7ZW34_9CHLO|nr:hypothetical protein TSOC_009350 [Tetrabaena socialis]|eukprot:PNH04475.1 hypothetical protein TSOC_009350 [Tetrabaena socialis]
MEEAGWNQLSSRKRARRESSAEHATRKDAAAGAQDPSQRSICPAGPEARQAHSPLLTLPPDAQQLILMHCGRGGRGAYLSCSALRRAFCLGLASPRHAARFCLAAWGARDAAVQALVLQPGIPAVLSCSQRDLQLGELVRAIAAAGGSLNQGYLLQLAACGGHHGALEVVLEACGEQQVPSCCDAIVHASSAGDAVALRLMLRFMATSVGISLHEGTGNAAMRNAACEGHEEALEVLLAADMPRSCRFHALQFASKSHHWRCVQLLLAAGAKPSAYGFLGACSRGHPRIVLPLARALEGTDALRRVHGETAVEWLCAARWRAENSYWDGQDWKEPEKGVVLEREALRAEALRFLLSRFGPVPPAAGGGGGDGAALANTCGDGGAPHLALTLLLQGGADADAALLAICNAIHTHWDAERAEQEAAAKLAQLLSMRAETGPGAARAVRVLLSHGCGATARALLSSGAVGAGDCEGLLAEVVGAEEAGAEAVDLKFINMSDGNSTSFVPFVAAMRVRSPSFSFVAPVGSGWKYLGATGSSFGFDFSAQRTNSTKGFSIFVFLAMWVLSIFCVVHAADLVYWRRRPFTLEVPAFSATLLFALPAVRQVQPGVPDVGAVIDMIGFFWNMVMLAIVCCLLLAAIYAQARTELERLQGLAASAACPSCAAGGGVGVSVQPPRSGMGNPAVGGFGGVAGDGVGGYMRNGVPSCQVEGMAGKVLSV